MGADDNNVGEGQGANQPTVDFFDTVPLQRFYAPLHCPNSMLLLIRNISVAAVNRHVEFDAVGFLRLLVRRGYLQAAGKGEYELTESWPPPASLFSKPVGITNSVPTWFRYYLQQWITNSMGQLESKEGVYSLDCRGEYGSGSSQPSSGHSDLAIPASSSRRAGTEGRAWTRCILRRRAEGFEIDRGRLG